jgi:hypothetical protein
MSQTGLSHTEQGLGHRYFVVAVTAIVVAILMYILTSKLDQEVDNAERKQFEFRLAELRSAVLLQESVLVAKDQMDQAYLYEGSNPMIWMEPETSHYLGEMSLESVTGHEGNWVYDPKLKVIAYKSKTESKWLQFKVVALWSKEKSSKGLRLKQIEDQN